MTVIEPNGNGMSDLLYSTYIGGNDPAVPPYLMPDRGLGIAVDDLGMVYLTGETGSTDFPANSESSSESFTDIFLMKLDLQLEEERIYIPIVLK